MKLKLLLSGLLICGCAALAEAVPKDNYGTEVCTQLVVRANALFNKGKYSDAKVLYEQALATGDTYYTKKCTAQLRAINTLLAGKKPPTGGTVFTISQDTVKINYLGGDYPVHVDGTNWKASAPSNDGWCKIDVDRRSGTVKIFCAKNESVDTRSTFVTITNGNGKKKTVEVINEGSPEILRSSAQNIVFTPDGETNVVDIDANTEWNIADVPSWLKAIKGSGDIQFTASPNQENRDRIAQVKVETPSKQEITINIIQGATLDSLAFNKNDLHFGPDGGDEYIHVLTNADDWRFGDFPHWCQLERVDDNTIRVHCTPNQPVDMPREASVNVTTGMQTLGINVFQAPKPIFNAIPVDGIGGRKISFGFSAGYVYPMVSASSSSAYTFSPVNYGLANEHEQVCYSSSGGFSVSAFADIRLYKNLYLNAGLNFLYYKYKNRNSGQFEWTTMTAATNRYLRGPAEVSFSENYDMALLDVPILASYRVPLTKRSHLRFDLGPVISLGLSSKLKFSGTTSSEKMRMYKIINGKLTDERFDNGLHDHSVAYDGTFDLYSKSARYRLMTSHGLNDDTYKDSKFDISPYNRVNFGLRLGAGYEYMGISLNVSYQFMLTNMANKKYWDGDRWNFTGNGTELMTGYSQHNNLLQITLGYTFRY